MNKIYTSIILTLLLLTTGCSMMNSKESLIEQANQGDIKSMVELNGAYEFGATKEGLEQYRIWSNKIDESANTEDILALTNMFYDNKLAFPDGRYMYENLLKLANTPQNKQATFALLKFYSGSYSKAKAAKLQSAFIKTATKQDLLDLYNVYQALNNHNGYKNRDKIKTIMVQKGYMENSITDIERLKKILNKKEFIQDSSLLLSNVLKSNDLDKIYEIGLFLGNVGSKTEEIRTLINENTEAFMDKVLTLKPTNEMEITALFYLSTLYDKYYATDLIKQKNILINADKIGKTERNKTLAFMYDLNEKENAKNIQFIDMILNVSRTKAYMNISKIYQYGKGKEPINIEQAKIWLKKADTAKKELANSQ